MAEVLHGKKLKAVRLVLEGLEVPDAAKRAGLTPETVKNLLRRDDVRKLQVEYAQDVLRSSAAKAAQALVRQLDSNNEWVVQNAASRILQYIQTMEDNQDATITVAFTSMPAPVLPSQTAVPTEGAID